MNARAERVAPSPGPALGGGKEELPFVEDIEDVLRAIGHLNESHRAMAAAKLATMRRGDNQHASIEATSQNEAAELMTVVNADVKARINAATRH